MTKDTAQARHKQSREAALEEMSLQTSAKCWQRGCRRYVLRQTVPDVCGGDRKSSVADGMTLPIIVVSLLGCGPPTIYCELSKNVKPRVCLKTARRRKTPQNAHSYETPMYYGMFRTLIYERKPISDRKIQHKYGTKFRPQKCVRQ